MEARRVRSHSCVGFYDGWARRLHLRQRVAPIIEAKTLLLLIIVQTIFTSICSLSPTFVAMSDHLHHECGLALLRLLKPLSYYQKKYGSPYYALNKLYLLMEKQHNRGQDGAGVANIKFDVEPGTRYISRHRSNDRQAIKDIFERIHLRFGEVQRTNPDKLNDAYWLKRNLPFTGELWLGH